MSMIYDCFLFNNELELLDIRLNVLNDVVDKFVITESTVTHTDEPKKLFYNENKTLFKKFRNKIIHNIITDTPPVSNPWIINDYQFSSMKKGLLDCTSEDTVIFGDVDEIPNPEKIKEWVGNSAKLKVFAQAHCHYYLNFTRGENTWLGTRMIRIKHLNKYKTLWIARFSKYDAMIRNGGWHFSYLGGVKKIQEKMRYSIHQEYNNDKYNTPEKIMRAIIEGRDIVEKGWKFHLAKDNFLPNYIVDNNAKFKNLLLAKNPKDSSFRKLQIAFLEAKHTGRVKFLRKIKRNYNKLLNE